MVSALDSGVSGPGSSPGRGHCVVFLGKTQCLSLPRCINGYWKIVEENITNCGEVHDLQWTSILFRGSTNTSSHFMLQKPG